MAKRRVMGWKPVTRQTQEILTCQTSSLRELLDSPRRPTNGAASNPELSQ